MVCLHATDPAELYLSAWARIDDSTAPISKALTIDRVAGQASGHAADAFCFRATRTAVRAGRRRATASPVVERDGSRRMSAAGFVRPTPSSGSNEASAHVPQRLGLAESSPRASCVREIPLIEGAIEYGTGKSWGGKVPSRPGADGACRLPGQSCAPRTTVRGRISRPRWATDGGWAGDRSASRGRGRRSWSSCGCAGSVPDGSGHQVVARLDLEGSTAALRNWRRRVALDGAGRLVLPDDVDEPCVHRTRGALLPALDPTTMGWFERDWYLGPHKEQVVRHDRNAGPTGSTGRSSARGGRTTTAPSPSTGSKTSSGGGGIPRTRAALTGRSRGARLCRGSLSPLAKELSQRR